MPTSDLQAMAGIITLFGIQECKAAELLIQKFNSPQNCIETITDQANNRSTDNINLMLSRDNI